MGMVIKNKKKKTKTSLTGYEWKCKFIDLNIQIGKMFGLVSMKHIDQYIEKDKKYKKQKNKKKKNEKKKKHKMKRGKGKNKKRKDKDAQEGNRKETGRKQEGN